MKNLKKAADVTMIAGGLIAAGSGAASATGHGGAGAHGVAAHSPGRASGRAGPPHRRVSRRAGPPTFGRRAVERRAPVSGPSPYRARSSTYALYAATCARRATRSTGRSASPRAAISEALTAPP